MGEDLTKYNGMNYSVVLRDRQTGECRRVAMDEWGDGCEFLWTDGNFGCDCNRDEMFERGEVVTHDYLCNTGANRYTVEYVEFASGDRVPLEAPSQEARIRDLESQLEKEREAVAVLAAYAEAVPPIKDTNLDIRWIRVLDNPTCAAAIKAAKESSSG